MLREEGTQNKADLQKNINSLRFLIPAVYTVYIKDEKNHSSVVKASNGQITVKKHVQIDYESATFIGRDWATFLHQFLFHNCILTSKFAECAAILPF